MEVVRVATPEEFLAATAAYRDRDALRTNILGTIPTTIVSGLRSYDECWWWVVRDGTGEVVGAALRTAPFGMQIGPMRGEGASALARAIAADDDALPGVIGSRPLVATFLDAYRAGGSPGSRRDAVAGRHTLLYELGDLVLPEVEGALRAATVGDLDLVVSWSIAFQTFIEGHAPILSHADRAAIATRLNNGMLYLWCLEGEPVSMAGRSTPIATPTGPMTRIAPVFTPEKLRGRGFGSAVTGALSAKLLAEGSRVCLYTDADYPTSNSVYRRLGYRVIDEAAQLEFTTPL
jgi:predicted GNAT family acetyltransferase